MKSNYSFPATKPVPHSFLATQAPAVRRIVKARHRKRVRRFWWREGLQQWGVRYD